MASQISSLFPCWLGNLISMSILLVPMGIFLVLIAMATLYDCQFHCCGPQDKDEQGSVVTWDRSKRLHSWGRGIWTLWGGLSGDIRLFLAFTEWPSFPFQVLRVQWGLCRQRQAVPWDPCYPLYFPPDLSQGSSSQPWEPRGSHGELTVWLLCRAEHNVEGVVQNPTELPFSCSFSYGFTKEVMQKYKVGLCLCLLYHVRHAFRRLNALSLFSISQVHGKKILKMFQNVFCWLPLATLIDQKVLIIHGGISDTTDLDMLEKIQRDKVGFTSQLLQETTVWLICGEELISTCQLSCWKDKSNRWSS